MGSHGRDAPPADDGAGAPERDAALIARAKILIVDDHPANLVALEAILSPLGHDLLRAQSGEEALKQILRHDFALILLDVQMSGMNGFDTAALVKQHPRSRHIPIIFITALSRDSEHVFQGYSQGAVDYLLKPVEPAILRSKAATFIDLHIKGETVKLQERILRRQEQEALERKSQHRFRSLLDSMPQCVWAATPDGTIHYCNRVGLEYCGISAAQLDGDGVWQVVHPDDRGVVRESWEATIRSRSSFEGPMRIRRAADGAYRWHLGAHSPRAQRAGAGGRLDRDRHRHRRPRARRGGAAARGHAARRLPVGRLARAAHAADVAEAGAGQPAPRGGPIAGDGGARAPRREAEEDRGTVGPPAPPHQRAAGRVAHLVGAPRARDRRDRPGADGAGCRRALPGRGGAPRPASSPSSRPSRWWGAGTATASSR
jgi:PAS domain S-box-containing protein